MSEPIEVHIHKHETDARVSEVLTYVKAIYAQGKKQMSQADEILNEAHETQDAVAAYAAVVETKLNELKAALEAAAADPAKLAEAKAIFDAVQADLAAKKDALSPPAPEPAPAPEG